MGRVWEDKVRCILSKIGYVAVAASLTLFLMASIWVLPVSAAGGQNVLKPDHVEAPRANFRRASAHGDTFKVIIVSQKQASDFEGTVEDIKNILVIAGILLWSILAYEALFRGLKSAQIQKVLDSDSANQRSIQERCHSLIDELFALERSNFRMETRYLQNLFTAVTQLDALAYQSRTAIANYSFILKRSIQNVLKYHEPKNGSLDANLLVSIASVLQTIEYQSQRFITFPSFWQFVRFSRKSVPRNSKLKKLTVGHSFRYYAFVERGLKLSPLSLESIVVLDEFNKIHSPLASRAAFRVFNDPHTIALLLYTNRLYVPVILTTTVIGFRGKPYRLLLAGFSRWESYREDNEKFLKCIYVTETDVEGLGKNLIRLESIDTTRDEFLNAEFDKIRFSNLSQNNLFTFTAEIRTSSCEEMFRERRGKLKKELESFKKSELRNWRQ